MTRSIGGNEMALHGARAGRVPARCVRLVSLVAIPLVLAGSSSIAATRPIVRDPAFSSRITEPRAVADARARRASLAPASRGPMIRSVRIHALAPHEVPPPAAPQVDGRPRPRPSMLERARRDAARVAGSPHDAPGAETARLGRTQTSPIIPFGRGEPYTLACYDVASADFDLDGDRDLAVASGANGISIGTNDGSGTFQWNAIASPLAGIVVAADFDGDGKPDLAAAIAPDSAEVGIFRGHGDDTFDAPVFVITPHAPSALAVADLDHDGRPDLIVGGGPADSVAILLNQGANAFVLGQHLPCGHYPDAIAVGDFNHDGFLDFALGFAFTPAVSIFRGNGDGSMADPTSYAVGVLVTSLATADLDRAGGLDLAGVGDNGQMIVLWNDGSGAFNQLDTYGTRSATYFSTIAIADVNQDSLPDLAVATSQSFRHEGWAQLFVQRTPRVFDGSLGYFTASTEDPNHVANVEGIFVALVDVDSDGEPDLIAGQQVANSNPVTGELLVIKHRGGLAFAGLADHELGTAAGPSWVQTIDFEATGKPNLLVQVGDSAVLMRSRPDGTLMAPESFPEAAYALAIDLNGDGRSDLLRPKGDSILVRITNPDGTLGQVGGYTNISYRGLGDFNVDQIPDLIVRFPDDSLGILLGRPTGAFDPPIHVHIPIAGVGPGQITSGYLNRDWKSDLVIEKSSGGAGPCDSVMVYFCVSESSFSYSGTYPLSPSSVCNMCHLPLDWMACRDVNGDGIDDLMALATADSDPGELSVLLNLGAGTLGPSSKTLVVPEHPIAHARDLDLDQHADIATASYAGDGFGRLWIGMDSGGGAYDGAKWMETTNYPLSVTAGDFDSDGRQDLAVACLGLYNGGSVTVLLNRGGGNVTAVFSVAVERARWESGQVELGWRSSGGVSSAVVERRSESEPWTPLAVVRADPVGRFEYRDATARAGRSYAYRLAFEHGASRGYSDVAWVTAPAARFGIRALGPNPAVADLVVQYSLIDARRASLELVDVAGRRLRAQTLDHPTPGDHRAELRRAGPMRPGIYWVRLVQGNLSDTKRVVFVE